MKILVAVDGSSFTKKALAFIVTNPELLGKDGELVVLNVQPPLPPRVSAMAGSAVARDYYQDEASKVLAPIEEFLRQRQFRFTARWVVGQPASEIVNAAQHDKAHMIVMGTHGHGLLGRTLMGSVAQKVVAESPIPVLLAK